MLEVVKEKIKYWEHDTNDEHLSQVMVVAIIRCRLYKQIPFGLEQHPHSDVETMSFTYVYRRFGG